MTSESLTGVQIPKIHAETVFKNTDVNNTINHDESDPPDTVQGVTHALSDRLIEEAFKNHQVDVMGLQLEDADAPTTIVDMTNQHAAAGHDGVTYKILKREPPQHYPISSSNIVDLIR